MAIRASARWLTRSSLSLSRSSLLLHFNFLTDLITASNCNDTQESERLQASPLIRERNFGCFHCICSCNWASSGPLGSVLFWFCFCSVDVLLLAGCPPRLSLRLPPSPSVSPSFPPWVGPSAISKLRLSSRSFLRAVRLGHSLPPFPAHLVLDSHPSPSPPPHLLLLFYLYQPSIAAGGRRGSRTEKWRNAQEEEEVQEAERIDRHIVCSHWPHAVFPSHFPFRTPLGSFTTTHTTTTTSHPTWVVLRFCRFRVVVGVFEWPRSARHVQGRLSFVCTGP